MMRVAREPINAPIVRVRWLTTVAEGGIGPSAADSAAADGSAIHGELRRAVAAGLTPADALRAATFDAARALGWQRRLGAVAPAKVADLLILDGNPLDDIGNTERIAALVFGGRLIDGAERNVLLARMGVR
jgi:adenine deaminase